MSNNFKKVAVLGTGVMGAQIAAHLTNAGIEVLAFDINQDTAIKGIEFSSKIKPNAYYNPKSISKIVPLNYDNHIDRLGECDWVIEVIAERLDLKQSIYNNIENYINKDAIVTSNTSGINLSDLIKEMSDDLKKRFFITHFFNPPRYMKLVEVVSHQMVSGKILNGMASFLEENLGKGVVYAKDTPNFIANRIGTYGMMSILDIARRKNISIEDVDNLTGTLIGRPKSATFRTADVVGLDVLSMVATTAYEKCKNDTERAIFQIPDFLKKMIKNGQLGQKTNQGFYKKIDKGLIYSLDLDTLEYSPMNKTRFSAIRRGKEYTSLEKRLKAIIETKDLAGDFVWEITAKTLAYSAFRVGEVSDDIFSIDNALKWGFGYEKGPFEMWDMLGFEYVINRMHDSKIELPDWISNMVENKNTQFYKYIDGKKCCYNIKSAKYLEINIGEKVQNFEICKNNNSSIKKHWSASLYDLGDNVAGLELHSVLQSTLNPIDGSMLEMMNYSLEWVELNKFKGLIISGDGPNFCAGINLNLVLSSIHRKDWKEIELLEKNMQDLYQMIRFSNFPVIATPYGLVLGGGCETINACDYSVAAAESYIGLVEVGVGLIPGAGGNLRMISNLSKKIKTALPGSFPIVQKAFECIGYAKVATSASQAMNLGYLRETDIISINRDHLLNKAKELINKEYKNYRAPELETYKLPGSSGRLVIESTVKSLVKSGKISEHDALIARKLGFVLTGGSKGGPFSKIDENYLLEIEREAFVSLCGEPKTVDRIEFMLKKGKPLRN